MAKKELPDYSIEELQKQAKVLGPLTTIFWVLVIITGIALVIRIAQDGIFRPVYAGVFFLFISAWHNHGRVTKIKAEIARRTKMN